jgi:FAD/FMN-containing dehydrogenase
LQAGNVVWRASQVASPETLEELQSLVARASAAGTTVRCVGRSHSFTPVCDTDGLLISLAKMQRVLAFDADKGLLTVEGGATYTAVNAFLAGTAWAVPNLATLPHFTVAGSMSMGTHGSSGVGEDGRATLGNQASQVEALEFVTADGSLQRYTQGDEHFEGTLVSLGCLGAVSRLTLRLVPSFFVQQAVYINATVEDVISHFRDMISSVDSFSWLVDWPGQEDSESEALGNLDPEDEGIRGRNRLLVRNFVPAPLLATFPADAWGGQLFDAPKQQGPTVMSDVPTVGPWYELLNTYGTGLPSGAGVEENTDAYGSGGSYDTREVQVEYFVPLEQAEEALRICHEVCRHWSYDVFLITELRVSATLSPQRRQDMG